MMRVGRGYVILAKRGDGDWHQFTAIVAFSQRGAIKRATPEGGEFEHGTFKAIPSKQWAFEVTK